MKNNILTDLKASTRLFLDMQKARKRGTEIKLEKKVQIPVFQSGGFYGTVEGCSLSHLDRDIVLKVHETFKCLPDETKHQLQFSPEDGEFVDRARFWRKILKLSITEKQCHIAMLCIIHWFIHIKQMHKEETGLSVQHTDNPM